MAAGIRSAGPLRYTLAGLGAFAITVGLLFRFYAAHALITAPPGFYGTQVLSDDRATYFDQATLTTKTKATLTDVNTIRGDVAAATGSTVTWDSYSYIWDPKTHVTLSTTYQRAVFNSRTGEMVDCCGAAINDDPRIRQYGVSGLFWPIGTQKTTYTLYDTSTDRAWPAVYRGTAVVQGILTYKYTQHIPATVVQKMPGIPMSILGIPGASYTVTANRTYQADNTFWIDPRTGVPVNVEEKVSSALHDPADLGSLTVVSADFKMSPSSQASLAAVANHSAAQIAQLREIGPLAGVILGVLLLLAAVCWPRRAASGARHAAGSFVRRAARRNSSPLSRTDHPVSPAPTSWGPSRDHPGGSTRMFTSSEASSSPQCRQVIAASRSWPQLWAKTAGGESTAHLSPQARRACSTTRSSRPASVSS
ncbi:MAG TPA: DUF3068 domain-containing protein [Trebonia sp.]